MTGVQACALPILVNVRNEDNDSGDVGGDKESGFFGGCRVVGEG